MLECGEISKYQCLVESDWGGVLLYMEGVQQGSSEAGRDVVGVECPSLTAN